MTSFPADTWDNKNGVNSTRFLFQRSAPTSVQPCKSLQRAVSLSVCDRKSDRVQFFCSTWEFVDNFFQGWNEDSAQFAFPPDSVVPESVPLALTHARLTRFPGIVAPILLLFLVMRTRSPARNSPTKDLNHSPVTQSRFKNGGVCFLKVRHRTCVSRRRIQGGGRSASVFSWSTKRFANVAFEVGVSLSSVASL